MKKLEAVIAVNYHQLERYLKDDFEHFDIGQNNLLSKISKNN